MWNAFCYMEPLNGKEERRVTQLGLVKRVHTKMNAPSKDGVYQSAELTWPLGRPAVPSGTCGASGVPLGGGGEGVLMLAIGARAGWMSITIHRGRAGGRDMGVGQWGC